jgi:hypothetical protein
VLQPRLQQRARTLQQLLYHGNWPVGCKWNSTKSITWKKHPKSRSWLSKAIRVRYHRYHTRDVPAKDTRGSIPSQRDCLLALSRYLAGVGNAGGRCHDTYVMTVRTLTYCPTRLAFTRSKALFVAQESFALVVLGSARALSVITALDRAIVTGERASRRFQGEESAMMCTQFQNQARI